MDLNRSFPVICTFSIVLAAFETLRHMPDFRTGSKPVAGRFG